MALPVLLLLGSAYLLGAIPFSLLIAKVRGVDLRQHGSGNAGATNALRVMGKGPGLLVFALGLALGLLFFDDPFRFLCHAGGHARGRVEIQVIFVLTAPKTVGRRAATVSGRQAARCGRGL